MSSKLFQTVLLWPLWFCTEKKPVFYCFLVKRLNSISIRIVMEPQIMSKQIISSKAQVTHSNFKFKFCRAYRDDDGSGSDGGQIPIRNSIIICFEIVTCLFHNKSIYYSFLFYLLFFFLFVSSRTDLVEFKGSKIRINMCVRWQQNVHILPRFFFLFGFFSFSIYLRAIEGKWAKFSSGQSPLTCHHIMRHMH